MEIGNFKYNNLIAGDFPTEVAEIKIIGPANFKHGDVVGITTADGVFKLVDSSAEDGSEKPVGIMAEFVSLKVDETAISTMYVKGEFSRRHVNFGGTDTFQNHQMAMSEVGLILRRTVPVV